LCGGVFCFDFDAGATATIESPLMAMAPSSMIVGSRPLYNRAAGDYGIYFFFFGGLGIG